MMEKILKPRAGLKVRLEDGTGFVAEEGQKLPLTAYYRRRLDDKDLVEVPERRGK